MLCCVVCVVCVTAATAVHMVWSRRPKKHFVVFVVGGNGTRNTAKPGELNYEIAEGLQIKYSDTNAIYAAVI